MMFRRIQHRHSETKFLLNKLQSRAPINSEFDRPDLIESYFDIKL